MVSLTGNKKLPWKHLRIMTTVNVCKIYFKGVKLKGQNFISLSCGVFELLRKAPKRWNPPLEKIGLGGPKEKNEITHLVSHAKMTLSSAIDW